MSAITALLVSLATQAIEPMPDASVDPDATYDYGGRAAMCGYFAEQILSYDGFDEAPYSLRETAPAEYYALALVTLNSALAFDLPALEGDLTASRHPYLQGADFNQALWFFTGSLLELNVSDAVVELQERYDPEGGDYRDSALELFEEIECRNLDTRGRTTIAEYGG